MTTSALRSGQRCLPSTVGSPWRATHWAQPSPMHRISTEAGPSVRQELPVPVVGQFAQPGTQPCVIHSAGPVCARPVSPGQSARRPPRPRPRFGSQSRPHHVQLEGGLPGVIASRTRPSSVTARRCSSSPVRHRLYGIACTATPCFPRITQERGSSAARSSRISTVYRTSAARKPVESSTSSCARASRRKIAYFMRPSAVET